MKRVEETIRGYLASNLTFLEDGLTLYKEEYELENPQGTKGFIDILAVDSNKL